MDNFEKVSPSEKKILDILRKLKPYEEIRIVADKDGRFDTFFYEQSTRVIISGGSINNVKDIWGKK